MFKLWLLLCCFSLELFLGFSNDLQPQCFKVHDNSCPNSNVTFWLYTKEFPNGVVLDPVTYQGTVWKTRPLKVLIHSLAGSRNSTPNLELLPELLRIPDIDIMVVDFANLTPDPCYVESVHNIRIVSRCLAAFLGDLLDKQFVGIEQIHLIGFGLGAHAAAFTSNELEKMHSKVSHITALDPSKALFLTSDLSQRLDPSDADFVDVIHTDIFIHGILQPLGHVDFYPNKGVVQPNCGPIEDIDTNDCYHKRAAEYYAESVFSPTKFWAFRCPNLHAFLTTACGPSNDLEELGYHTRRSARGSYFLETNNHSPYARGRDFDNMDHNLEGETFLPMKMLEQLKSLGDRASKLTEHI
ncbi:hypothetical protein ACLKA6_015942 [Drosophila palustris]